MMFCAMMFYLKYSYQVMSVSSIPLFLIFPFLCCIPPSLSLSHSFSLSLSLSFFLCLVLSPRFPRFRYNTQYTLYNIHDALCSLFQYMHCIFSLRRKSSCVAKERRTQINQTLGELSLILCPNEDRLDKLTVVRLAAATIKLNTFLKGMSALNLFILSLVEFYALF